MRNLFLRGCVLSLSIMLCACSTVNDGKFYQNDGPPSSQKIAAQSARPKVETFKPATLRPYTVLGQRFVPKTQDLAYTETGTASWYGKQFHGKKTAIGEPYNMHAATAAHPTWPLPSYASVTNLENGKSIIVRVNDRGPFLHNRIIDLSFAAANALGYAQKGTAKVRITRLTNSQIRQGNLNPAITSAPVAGTQPAVPQKMPAINPAPALHQGWGIQVGFFKNMENAQAWAAHAQAVLASRLDGIPEPRIVAGQDGYRVVFGAGLPLAQARLQAAVLSTDLGITAFPVQK